MRKHRTSGFTLVELAVVVSILLVLIVALAPRIGANRAAQFYSEAQNLAFSVAQAANNYLVQDPDRTPTTFIADLRLPAGPTPPGMSGTFYDCSQGGNLNPAVAWNAAGSVDIKCAFEPLSDGRFRVYAWWTKDTRKVFVYP